MFSASQPDRPRPPSIQPVTTTNFVITAGNPATVQGPSALLPIVATLSVVGGVTNEIQTEWSFFNSPGTVVFDSRNGLTNLAQFQAQGRYSLRFKARKGAYENESTFEVFITDQNITNFIPTITLTSPPNGSEFTAPVDILIVADAQDRDGTITNVVFYSGSTPIKTNTSAPWSMVISNAAAGNYVFAANVWDNRGATNISTSVSVVVRPPGTPILTPPLVNITIPTNQMAFTAPVTFNFTATVVDLDGLIATVTFSDNGVVLAVLTPADLECDPDSGVCAPYEVSLSPSVGLHTIQVTALDNDNLQSVASATFTVSNPPNALPTVSLVSPVNGSTATAPATISLIANASDTAPGTIAHVRFFVNGVQYGADTTDPYSFPVTGLGVGTYAFYAQAVDDQGGVKNSNTNTVTVNPPPGTPPVVSLTSPVNNQAFAAGSTVTLSANATDDGSVTNVSWYSVVLSDPDPVFPPTVQGETLIGSDTTAPYSISWIPASSTYILIAKAWDNLGLISTSSPPVTITVNQPIPPVVQLTSPANNAVFTQGDTIAMTATASDQDGTVTKVDFMQFQPDVFIVSDSSSPYTGNWVGVPAGSYSLVAKAYDSSGLTTISTAIHITINATPPQPVVVDAGPFPTATLSPYKTYFDTEYVAQSANFNSLAASGTGANYSTLQLVIDGTISMYEGTRETNYLNRALIWCETMISRATVFDTSGLRNWAGTWASPYSSTNIAFQIEEFTAGMSMSRAARLVLADPDLRAVFGARATAIYNFVRDHIVNKNFVTRPSYPAYADWSQNTASPTSDKPLLALRLILDLKSMSALLANSDTATYGWATKATELAEGVKDYNGKEARFLPWQFPNALIWGHGKTWQTYNDFDTDHGNRLAFAVVQGFEQGQTFTSAHVTGLSELLTKVLWDGSTGNPQVRNFMDGSNGAFGTTPAFGNGKTYDGFYLLGGYNTNVLNFSKYTALAVKNGVVNPTLTYQGTSYGRTAMSGHIARDVALLEYPPFAILKGTVSGSGTTGTNWTHVAGPGGYTILTPGRPNTVVLFNNPAAVGSHTFRLTVTSATPTVSDDVVVTVQAEPPFGTIGPGTPPVTNSINQFSRRYIFYRMSGSAPSGGFGSAAQYTRITNIIQRGASVGYNGIVVQDGSTMFGAAPGATALANLSSAVSYANSLGVKFIPYSFSQSEPVSSSLIDLREAFPVVDTKFIRSGSTALPVGDPSPVLVNPGFETFTGNSPSNWGVDDPGIKTFVDSTIKHGGLVSMKIVNPTVSPNKGRLSQSIAVVPFRSYKVSAWIKTQSLSPSNLRFYVQGNSNARVLSSWLGASSPPATQDWLEYVNDFNSLENTSVTIWIMSGSSATGTFWVDDVAVTEAGLFSTVRRASLPVTVKLYAGSPTYTEGSDYVVGNQLLTIPGGSTIPVGASLKVSWFELAEPENPSQRPVPGSICNADFFNVYTTNASRVNARTSPTAWMVRANEWRVGNWDPACGSITMGQYLSNFVVRTEGVINAINPNIERYFWSDMWSPWHNSKVQYECTKGDLHGDWLGFSSGANGAIAVNWNNESKTTPPIKFWAGMDPSFPKPFGRQVLAIYYDSLTDYSKNYDGWESVLAQAEAQGLPGNAVIGILFTSWNTASDGFPGNYTYLESTANYIKSKSPSRWLTGPAF